MKAMQFQNQHEILSVMNMMLSKNLIDDSRMEDPMAYVINSHWYVLESVPGIIVLSDFSVRRDGNVTIMLADERPNLNGVKRGSAFIHELREAIQYAFEKYHFIRLSAPCLEENKRSRHLMRALGFRYEGTLRNAALVHGIPHNIRMYSMTVEDLSHDTENDISQPATVAGHDAGTTGFEQLFSRKPGQDQGRVHGTDQCADEPVAKRGWLDALWPGKRRTAAGTHG